MNKTQKNDFIIICTMILIQILSNDMYFFWLKSQVMDSLS